MNKSRIRIGYGYDVHTMKTNHPFWLGGIKIEHTHGAFGHSDADVLIHAICDALLGAANLRDIGYHFSDKDPKFKNIGSKILLKGVIQLLKKEHYNVGNIDTTVCLETPKINPYIPEMKECLATIMEIEKKEVSIKATTSEKMGFVGKKEGITAHAAVLIYEN